MIRVYDQGLVTMLNKAGYETLISEGRRLGSGRFLDESFFYQSIRGHKEVKIPILEPPGKIRKQTSHIMGYNFTST